jgi:hypothetical protein
MSQSKSSPTNTTSNQTAVKTTNNNVSGTSGITLANNSGPTSLSVTANTTTNTTSVDPQVVAAALSSNATAFGVSANVATQAINSNQKIDQATIDASTGLAKQSLNIAQSAVTQEGQQNQYSLDTISTLASGFATQLEGVVASEQNALEQDQAASQTQLANVTQSLATSFVQGSQSADTQVVDSETTTLKYVLIGVVAIAAVYLLTKSN